MGVLAFNKKKTTNAAYMPDGQNDVVRTGG
jgi:hypothetical protein